MSASNGLRLYHLINVKGTETMRMYFDSIHAPATLPATLNSNYTTLKGIRVMKHAQMQTLFPPNGVLPSMPSSSKDYDITLLFILIRNICGLHPPGSTGLWDKKPPPSDPSPEADLARIKYYRNQISHASIEVSDVDFNTYWNEISVPLVRLRCHLGLKNPGSDIAKLKTGPLDGKRHVFREICLGILFILWVLCALYAVSISFPKQPQYSYPLNVSNPDFVGREWVFRDLEKILNRSGVCGVQLVADPGWGKSAIMRRLINSSTSSAVIHENTIAYHFCKYNEKSTRDGERFVMNLVHLISRNIPEFRKIANINREQSRCKENPKECFQKAIVEPLDKLSKTRRNISFILIDALDECLEKEEGHKSIILKILSSGDIVSAFPKWVKLIISSRKKPLTVDKMSTNKCFKTLKMNEREDCNRQDLRTYAERALQNLYTKIPSTEEKLPLNYSINLILKFAKDNFLFLKTFLNYWGKYPFKMNSRSIPDRLEDIYSTSFVDRFKESDFNHFEPFLEVLLAANSPPTLSKLDNILDFSLKNFKTRKIANKLSEYFKSDIEQEPLEFYHQSFAEWLIKQTGHNGIVIEKSKGHKYIVYYLFHYYRERHLSFKELSELCTHILHGSNATIDYVSKLSSLNVSEVRDSSNRSILHDLAPKKDATQIIRGIIKQFKSVDILDIRHWTPAMYAVQEGSYENVKIFIDNGADVNHAVELDICDVRNYVSDNPWFWGALSDMSFIAAYKGYANITELLVSNEAKIDRANKCGWKPLYVAVVMGHFETVQFYIQKGAQADAISLHHAAARNHTEIVRFLLDTTGIRDECLRCKSANKSWCRVNLNRFHHCVCETALHAAVSRDNLDMAKLILQYSNASVNCKHGSGLTPLMEVFTQNNSQMVEVLVNAGAHLDAECVGPTSDFLYNCVKYGIQYQLYNLYCEQLVCNGKRATNFAFAHGLWEMVIPFISKYKVNASSPDNDLRRSSTIFAAIYDLVEYISVTYGNKIDSVPNIKTILRYVVVCHSVKTLKYLLSSGDLSKFIGVYEDGKTLLHYATLGSSKTESCVCPKLVLADKEDKERLETITLLTKALASEINKQDNYGRTALHYAAVHALPKVVENLVNAGADKGVKDQKSANALEFALCERPLNSEFYLPCRLTSDQVLRVCYSTLFDEVITYLLQNETIKKCDSRAKKVLDGLMYHRLPLSLYELFKSGLDVNCAHEHFKRLLKEIKVLHCRGMRANYILEVFKIFEIDVKVFCDVPFIQSALHMMAYLRRPGRTLRGNLFRPSVSNTSFPLQRFIKDHPKGVEILNECYDKEGYLAIHRAVQGDNVDAVFWFVEIGVDLSKKTKSNLSTLALATYQYDENIFEKLLEITEKKRHASFHCNIDFIGLSPLHVAGSKGMGRLETIHNRIPALPLNYRNSHGIQPVYLAYLHHATHKYPLPGDKEAFKNLGLSPDKGPSTYPEREAEYHLIYGQYYHTPQKDLRVMLDHDTLFKCPNVNELLPHKSVIKDYIKLEACASRCWQSSFGVGPFLQIFQICTSRITFQMLLLADFLTLNIIWLSYGIIW